MLARDALAEPYEVAKLADGLAPVLRSQRRLSLRGMLGPDTLILEQRGRAEDRAVAFYLTTTQRTSHAVLARMQATYPGLHPVPASPDPLLATVALTVRLPLVAWLRGERPSPVALEVVRLKKQRRWVWSLQTTKDYTTPPSRRWCTSSTAPTPT